MKKINATQISVFSMLSIFSVLFIVPILFVFISSFRSKMDVTIYPDQLLPHKFTLQNYIVVLFETPYAPVFKWLWNSTFVATVHTALLLILCSMAAFAFARMKFKGKEIIFWLLLSSMMIPSIVNFVPLYKIMSDFKLIDSYWALILPGIENAFDIFLIRQFMRGIPRELEESAHMDGANSWQIFTKMIIPLSRPVLFVVGLFAFRNNWNSLLWPLVATNSLDKRTITAGLTVAQGTFENEFTLVNTITVMSALPLLIIFIFVQKYFTEGLSISSSLKE